MPVRFKGFMGQVTLASPGSSNRPALIFRLIGVGNLPIGLLVEDFIGELRVILFDQGEDEGFQDLDLLGVVGWAAAMAATAAASTAAARRARQAAKRQPDDDGRRRCARRGSRRRSSRIDAEDERSRLCRCGNYARTDAAVTGPGHGPSGSWLDARFLSSHPTR
jgi:hypothetical protein